MRSFDAIVVGLGAMGSAAAWQLGKKGLKVLGIDQHTPPHPWGSTHGGSRITRQAYKEGSEYVPMLIRSYEIWREIEQLTGKELLNEVGGLMIGKEDSSIIQKSLESARSYSLSYELLSRLHMKDRFPVFSLRDDEIALFDHKAGMLKPEACVEAQLDLAKRAGAELHFSEKVIQWESQGSKILIHTDKESYRAKHCILSTGPWAGQWLESTGVEFSIDRVVQYWVQPKSGVQAYLPTNFPIWLWRIEENMEYYGFPSIDGADGGVKISYYPLGDHPQRELCTPHTIRRETSEEDLRYIRSLAQTYSPDLNHTILRSSTCMHTLTADMNPLIGPHPEAENLLIAAGFSGHGFKFSNVVGEMLADMIADGKSTYDMHMFDTARFVD